jgi:hypothetical protein
MPSDILSTDRLPDLLPGDAPSSSEAAPSGFGPTLAIDSAEGWLRWSRFSYELPPDHAGRRRTLWRQLRQVRALKLLPGEWAMAHDEHDDPNLDRLVTAVRAAGGSATVREVGRSGVDEVELQVRLCRSCESLWDPSSTAPTGWRGLVVRSCRSMMSIGCAGGSPTNCRAMSC